MIVLCAGALKAGSTWYLRLADALLVDQGCRPCAEAAARRPGRWVVEPTECRVGLLRVHRAAALLPDVLARRGVALKTHAGPTPAVGVLRRLGLRTVSVWRDPREIAPSLLRQAQGRPGSLPGVGDLDQATDLVLARAPEWLAWRQDPRTLRVDYADLVRDPVGEVVRLGHHVGRPLSSPDAARVVASVEAESRQDWDRTKRSSLLAGDAAAPSEAEVVRCEQRLAPLVAAMGYA